MEPHVCKLKTSVAESNTRTVAYSHICCERETDTVRTRSLQWRLQAGERKQRMHQHGNVLHSPSGKMDSEVKRQMKPPVPNTPRRINICLTLDVIRRMCDRKSIHRTTYDADRKSCIMQRDQTMKSGLTPKPNLASPRMCTSNVIKPKPSVEPASNKYPNVVSDMP